VAPESLKQNTDSEIVQKRWNECKNNLLTHFNNFLTDSDKELQLFQEFLKLSEKFQLDQQKLDFEPQLKQISKFKVIKLN